MIIVLVAAMDEKITISKSFRGHIRILKILGLWKPSMLNEKLFIIYSFIVIFMIMLPIPCLGFISIWMDKEIDLKTILDAIFINLELGIIPIKLLTLYRNYEKFKYHIEYLDGKMFNSYTKDQEHIIRNGCDRVENVRVLFFIMVLLAVVSWACVPLVDLSTFTLPIGILLPFDSKSTVSIYIIGYIYTALGGGAGAMLDSALDPLIAGLIIQATTQVKVLKDTLRNLSERAEKKLSEEGNLTLGKRQWASKKSDLIFRDIVKCVDHYESIITYAKEIESTYAAIFFVQFAASILVICISTFELTTVHPGSFEFFSLISFTLCMLWQIFLYCYYGNDLYNETSSLTEAIYLGDWLEYDVKAKRALLILMERSKRPVMLSPAMLFDLSLGTFTTILRRAYSFFAVLQNMNN